MGSANRLGVPKHSRTRNGNGNRGGSHDRVCLSRVAGSVDRIADRRPTPQWVSIVMRITIGASFRLFLPSSQISDFLITPLLPRSSVSHSWPEAVVHSRPRISMLRDLLVPGDQTFVHALRSVPSQSQSFANYPPSRLLRLANCFTGSVRNSIASPAPHSRRVTTRQCASSVLG